MATDPILDAEKIERKPVAKHDQTDGRENAARFIEEMWPASCTEIAKESGYSRQHISNTLKTYFRPADSADTGVEKPAADETGQRDISSSTVEVDIMKLVEVYGKGYRDALRDLGVELSDERLESADGSMSDLMGVVDK